MLATNKNIGSILFGSKEERQAEKIAWQMHTMRRTAKTVFDFEMYQYRMHGESQEKIEQRSDAMLFFACGYAVDMMIQKGEILEELRDVVTNDLYIEVKREMIK